MHRVWLKVHVAEPFDFARYNGGEADVTGWTAQGSAAYPDWVVHLDSPAKFGEEEFDKIKLSPRYAGESVAKVLEGFGFTGVNICYPQRDEHGRQYWHFGMVGSVLLAPQPEPQPPQQG
jgi:hypothetical protein